MGMVGVQSRIGLQSQNALHGGSAQGALKPDVALIDVCIESIRSEKTHENLERLTKKSRHNRSSESSIPTPPYHEGPFVHKLQYATKRPTTA